MDFIVRRSLFFTRAVFDAFVDVPEGVEGQDESGHLWDAVWMPGHAIRSS